MATQPNIVPVACKITPALTTTPIPIAGAFFRGITPEIIGSGSGNTAPVGPQRWPLKL